MELRPATAEDLSEVAKTSISHGEKEAPESLDFVFAIDDHGKILAVGGAKVITESTAFVWLNLAEEARSRMILIYRVVRDWLDGWEESRTPCRLMAAVRTDFEEGKLTVEHLGFEIESVMPKFFGNEDAYMYVRIKEDK